MIKLIKPFLLFFLLLIATINPAAAETITLAWDPSPSPNISGYNVFYQENTSEFPFNGTSLPEGASPIAVDGPNSTSLEINFPDDGSIYYFAVTAVNDAGLESSFSNIVSTEWIPLLLAPTDSATVDTTVTFAWDLPPESYNVSFDLYYGTDPNLDPNAMAIIAPGTFSSNWPQFQLNVAIPLAILLSLLLAISSGRTKRLWHPVRVGLCVGIIVLQASCGGGGGGDDAAISPSTEVSSAVVPSEVAPEPSAAQFTEVVYDIYGTEYQITDLLPNTQYYWKIIAVDNWGFTYESIVQTFTTLND
jgi:hypothetical protein